MGERSGAGLSGRYGLALLFLSYAAGEGKPFATYDYRRWRIWLAEALAHHIQRLPFTQVPLGWSRRNETESRLRWTGHTLPALYGGTRIFSPSGSFGTGLSARAELAEMDC